MFPLLNFLAFIVMIVVNTLSVTLPLGGISIGELSALYPNPFTPAAMTFSIWSVIYLFLFIFSTYPLLLLFWKKKIPVRIRHIGYWYSLSCMLNALWVCAWQYRFVGTSVVIMIALLLVLIHIYQSIRKESTMRAFDRWIIFPAFSLYLGWISVATIANITAWTVHIGWSGWGLSQIAWTNIMIVVATLLGTAIYARFRDIICNLVIIWALYGIMTKRVALDPIEFGSIVLTTQLCMAFLVGLISSRWILRK